MLKNIEWDVQAFEQVWDSLKVKIPQQKLKMFKILWNIQCNTDTAQTPRLPLFQTSKHFCY